MDSNPGNSKRYNINTDSCAFLLTGKNFLPTESFESVNFCSFFETKLLYNLINFLKMHYRCHSSTFMFRSRLTFDLIT